MAKHAGIIKRVKIKNVKIDPFMKIICLLIISLTSLQFWPLSSVVKIINHIEISYFNYNYRFCGECIVILITLITFTFIIKWIPSKIIIKIKSQLLGYQPLFGADINSNKMYKSSSNNISLITVKML